MKVVFVAVVALMAVAAVQADCGCLKCSKNLYVASPPSSPVKVIYRGAACSCNRQLPYTIEQPVIQAPKPVTLRHCTYKCMPMKIVKQAPTPLYSYDSIVEVPVPERKPCNRYLVGLVAQPDRVVLPAPSCREPAPPTPSGGPVFEALSTVEDDDYLYQYPIKKCGCRRYLSKPEKVPKIGPRCSDGYRELTEEEVEDNIDKNIKDIYFDDTLEGRVRRWFYHGLSDLQKSEEDDIEPLCCCLGNFSLGLGKINFGQHRTKREVAIRKRTKRALLPFLAPQRSASHRYQSEDKTSDKFGEDQTRCEQPNHKNEDASITRPSQDEDTYIKSSKPDETSIRREKRSVQSEHIFNRQKRRFVPSKNSSFKKKRSIQSEGVSIRRNKRSFQNIGLKQPKHKTFRNIKNLHQSEDPSFRKKRSLDVYEEENEIPHGHDKKFEEVFEETLVESEDELYKSSNLLLDTLQPDNVPIRQEKKSVQSEHILNRQKRRFIPSKNSSFKKKRSIQSEGVSIRRNKRSFQNIGLKQPKHKTFRNIKNFHQSEDPLFRKKRSLDLYEEENEIPHGHDEDFEEVFEETPIESEDESYKASNLLLDTLHVDQLLPQIPLLLFVNAPISMLAQFHKLNKHFEPVVQSVPTVIRTSGKYFTDFGNKFKKTFYVFTNCLMSGFEDFGRRLRRSSDSLSTFQVLQSTLNPDGTVNFLLFNNSTKTKLKNIALVIENFKMNKKPEETKMYLAKIESNSLKERIKRDLFEADNGDLQELLRETWGHLFEDSAAQSQRNDLKSAEAIFEDHFNQIPRLYDALKQSKIESKDLVSSKPQKRIDPILGVSIFSDKKKHEDFGDLHPEKNLDIIKKEITTVLNRLQSYLQTDIDKDLKFYEDLVKLQYLKNTLVVDWRKHLISDQSHVVSAKMNILNYIKELEKLRSILTKKVLNLLINQPESGAYNRSELIKFLVELYKLQMIFMRIHEDLNDKIQVGSRFNHANEDVFIRQLEKVHFVQNTNKFELEQHLKSLKDSQVENNMKFLEKLRRLSELDESIEMEHDEREEVHQVAKMIQENAHYKLKEVVQVKEISNKVTLKQTYRKELKTLWDLERHILNNEDFLMSKINAPKKQSSEEKTDVSKGEDDVQTEEDDSLEKFDILKLAAPIKLKPLGLKDLKNIAKELKPSSLNWDKDVKEKMDEIVKDIEDKRKAWLRKTKKMADIMKEP